MAKPTTSYTRAPASSVATWLLNSTTVLLNSTTALLNGFFTAVAPNMLNQKNTTPFAKVAKNTTAYARNSDTSVGITAGSLVVQANSTIVRATGYIAAAVPNMLNNKPLTAYAAV